MKHKKLFGCPLRSTLDASVCRMSAGQFLRFTQKHSAQIKEARYLPERLGFEGFGSFEIERR